MTVQRAVDVAITEILTDSESLSPLLDSYMVSDKITLISEYLITSDLPFPIPWLFLEDH